MSRLFPVFTGKTAASRFLFPTPNLLFVKPSLRKAAGLKSHPASFADSFPEQFSLLYSSGKFICFCAAAYGNPVRTGRKHRLKYFRTAKKTMIAHGLLFLSISLR